MLYRGTLFTIFQYTDYFISEEEFEQSGIAGIGRYLFATENATYVVMYTTDVQYDRNNDEQKEEWNAMEQSIKDIQFVVEVSQETLTSESDEQLELILLDASTDVAADNFDVSAVFKDSSIIISEDVDGIVINMIPIEYDEYKFCLDMIDAENGWLLYCSSPAGGQMMKYLYTTSDRWNTYREINISNKMYGYPTSLSVLSSEHFYIGAQMLIDGYLFETTDGGEQWTSVYVDESIEKVRDGYVPIFDEDDGIIYTVLECDGIYLLYKSNNNQTAWEQIGMFTLESSIDMFYIDKGSFYIIDYYGRKYQIEY